MVTSLSVWDCNFLQQHSRMQLFQPFMSGSNKSGRDHVVGESASPPPNSTVIVQITLSAVKFHPSLVRMTVLKLYGVPPSFNHLPYSVLPKCVCILLKINFHAFYAYEVILCFYCRYSVSSGNQTGVLY